MPAREGVGLRVYCFGGNSDLPLISSVTPRWALAPKTELGITVGTVSPEAEPLLMPQV